MEFTIFCDGSIIGGNPGGCGGYATILLAGITDHHRAVQKEDIVVEHVDYEYPSTNQRMEMWAALKGIQLAWHRGATKVLLVSDSAYTLDGLFKWLSGWKARDWKTSDGRTVANLDLWKALDRVIRTSGIEVIPRHVRGHKGNPGNEYVDAAARAMAMKALKERQSGNS